MAAALVALFGSETFPRLLAELASSPDRRFTTGELEVRVGASHDSLYRALQRGVEAGLVERELGREVNAMAYPRADVERRLAEGDGFLREVFRQPKVMLAGREDALPAIVGQ